jgi:hypothetical protein
VCDYVPARPTGGSNMVTFFLTSGVVVIVAAIVGGQVKGAGMEFPLIASFRRQLALALFGVFLLASAFIAHEAETAEPEVKMDPSTIDLSPQKPPPKPLIWLDPRTEITWHASGLTPDTYAKEQQFCDHLKLAIPGAPPKKNTAHWTVPASPDLLDVLSKSDANENMGLPHLNVWVRRKNGQNPQVMDVTDGTLTTPADGVGGLICALYPES